MQHGVPISSERRILIASDFDGTLCPLADRPEQVRVAPEMLNIVRRLTESRRVRLAVISGRSLADVASQLPVDAAFAGNHGLEIQSGGHSFQHPEALRLRPDVAVACAFLREVVQPWTGCQVEDKGLTAVVHLRNVELSEHASLVRAVTRTVKPLRSSFALRPAANVLELCPRVRWDKGDALRYIREKLGPFDVCVCLGDGQSDEAMFRANRGQWNVKIGPGPSAAQYRLPDCSAVVAFLASLYDAGHFQNITCRRIQAAPV